MAAGTTFENAFAQIAVCNASRTSVLSGLSPGVTGVHFNYEDWFRHVDPAATIPAMLRSAGLETGIVGKVFHAAKAPARVEATIADYIYRSPGSAYDEGGVLDSAPYSGLTSQHGDYLSLDHAIDFVAAAGEKPFALFLGIVKPHVAWDAPQEFYDMYPLDSIVLPFTLDGDLSDVPPFMQALVFDDIHQAVLDANYWKSALQGYFASVTFADAMLGRLLDALEAGGQMDETAILVWTDHGYHLGDKDNWHKFTLWEEAARAPVIIALPGTQDDGQRVGQVVELVDIMPTVLDLMGAAAPEGLSGRSLVPFLDNPALLDDAAAISTMYGSASIRTNSYRFTLYEDGSSELYDIGADPNEWNNLTTLPEYADVRAQLWTKLHQELSADGWVWVEPGMAGTGSAGTDAMVVMPGGGTANGMDGDDAYFVTDPLAQIVEGAEQGTDKVYVGSDYVLPDNVENMELRARSPNAHLVGNAMANNIIGSGVIEGMDGDDILRGTSGGTLDGGNGDDSIQGSQANDTLRGGAGRDYVRGSDGNDIIDGGSGDDDLYGDAGNDTVSYLSAAAGVAVTLVMGTAQDIGGAGFDIFHSIENLTGSAFGDRLTGNGDANILKGLDGDDYLALSGGSDVMDGGNGSAWPICRARLAACLSTSG